MLLRVSLIYQKISWPLEKAKSRHGKNNKQHKQSAQRPAQRSFHAAQQTLQRGIPQPAVFQRLRSDAVYSRRCGKQGIKKKYHGNLNEATTPLLGKIYTEKGTLQAKHPSGQPNKRERFRSSKGRRPRDALPVLVVLGVDRGQELESRFVQLPFVATSTACCCCTRYDIRDVRYVAAAVVVRPSRRNPQTRKEQIVACTLMQHVEIYTAAVAVINLLDLYNVESAALHG